jgi:hypothetical protein
MNVKNLEKTLKAFVKVEEKICRNLEKIYQQTVQLKETYLAYHEEC